jgi:hypothetical protein
VKPSARTEGIPAEVEELVLRLIARQPADRPRDAFAVVDALGDLLRRLGGGTAPSPPSYAEASLSMPTVAVDQPVLSTRGEVAPEIVVLPTSEIAARWHGILAELAMQVGAAGEQRGDCAGVRRARELSVQAADLVASLERAKSTVGEYQARVDRLETQGRNFRGTLGHAIDTLSRDRSRARSHLEAVTLRREGVDRDPTRTRADRVGREVLVWEDAALQAEEARARAVEDDLAVQVEALQRQLASRNEQLDGELSDATGKLEGALAALRRMTGDLIGTIEEAASEAGR